MPECDDYIKTKSVQSTRKLKWAMWDNEQGIQTTKDNTFRQFERGTVNGYVTKLF